VSARIVGVLAREKTTGWASCFLLPSARGQGYGDEVVDRLGRRVPLVAAHDDCRVIDYYFERGFRQVRREAPFTIVEHPSRRDDLRQGASICLLDPISRRVLLGKRRTPPWLGYWAFPGGKLLPGEDAFAAGVREFVEETGVVVPAQRPVLETTVHVGAGEVVFAVMNFVVLTLATPTPRATDELDAEWVPLDTALALRPMAAGTRRVLRRVLDLQPVVVPGV
jgi:8-oxo-dGTP pyrophosphatase MutT (NUDIX family)